MKASFENSVSVLVRAYMNNTLEHGVCTACAVGNLVADALGTRPKGNSFGRWIHDFLERTDDEVNRSFVFENGAPTRWESVFSTHSGHQSIRYNGYVGLAKKHIDATGYTVDELARVEKAFESASRGSCHDDWMFNGLMAVVDVLADIHQVDLSVKETAIGQFKEVQALKLV